MKRYVWLILLVIFFFVENGLTEHRERGVIRQGQDVCEYEIYFKDGYIGNQDAHIRVILKAPLRAVHPVLEIRFTSTKGDSVHTICDLTERNRCLKEVWSGGVPHGPRGELRSFSGEHIVYPESLGKLGHFGDKRESTYRNQDWERGFIEIICSGERVLVRVPYFVRLQADRGFITFGQAAVREQRLYEQIAQPQSLPPPPSLPPQVYTPDQRPRDDELPSGPFDCSMLMPPLIIDRIEADIEGILMPGFRGSEARKDGDWRYFPITVKVKKKGESWLKPWVPCDAEGTILNVKIYRVMGGYLSAKDNRLLHFRKIRDENDGSLFKGNVQIKIIPEQIISSTSKTWWVGFEWPDMKDWLDRRLELLAKRYDVSHKEKIMECFNNTWRRHVSFIVEVGEKEFK